MESRTSEADGWLDALAAELGLSLGAYKREQLVRRAAAFAHQRGLDGPWELVGRVRADRLWAEECRHYLTIPVTAFFRDPPYWAWLEQLLAARPRSGRLRVWSAAAATGAEPLSVAALLRRLGFPADILATDVDDRVIREAGEYGAGEIGGIDETMRRILFEAGSPGRVRVRPEIRAQIRYRRLDLLQDPYPPGPFDLILCRNVLIYFTPEERHRVVGRLVERLCPAGVLFVGATEVLLNPEDFGLTVVYPALYRRRA
jgi:chemotaxis protein methyltransferase CheR